MEYIKLIRNNEIYDFDLIKGTKEGIGIDFSSLYEKTGLFSYDPGLKSTAVCSSSISHVDERKRTLFYRGKNIEKLIDKYGFLDIAYLLIYGKIPSKKSYTKFSNKINLDYSYLNKLLDGTYIDIKNIRPINCLKILLSLVIAKNSIRDSEYTITHILSLMPMLISYIANKGENNKIDVKNDYIETFLSNYFNGQNVSPQTMRLIQKFLILHMEHGQNASTTAVELIESTGNTPANSILGGILALEGNKHGGAMEQAVKMFESINSYQDMLELIEKVKNKKQYIFGLGHRIYKAIDLRAAIIKNLCMKHFSSDPLFQKANELEKCIINDEYFIERKLYPNIDFYSGILLKNLGIETDMFLLFFILARTVGWLSHWKEMNENSACLIRPRQIYIGD